MTNLIPLKRIENKILFMRGQNVLIDRDLAELYDVETSQLKRQVRRNIDRFPDDFMFELSKKELESWRCQFGTSNDKMGLRYSPMAFTEHGVAMLSTVLKSKRAIQVNITIVRAFIKMREMLMKDQETTRHLNDIEDRLGAQEFQALAIIDQLSSIKKKISEPEKQSRKKIGFDISEGKD